MSISRFSLRDKVTLRLLKLYFYIADVVEWSRALDIRLSELIREKTKCNIWNREKYEEIIHLISTEPKNEDKTNFYYYIIKNKLDTQRIFNPE